MPREPRRTRAIDEDVYHWFYRVERRSVVGLSDGGGPFGFDITAALQVDYLIDRYGCDAIVETGCHRGDTTEYLALRYPDIPLISCDIDAALAAQTRDRLGDNANVSIRHADSPDVVKEANGRYRRPFYYLDAHGGDDWPLAKEIQAIDRGIVCIDDFDIGHERYHYDTYNGVRCGPEILVPFRERIPFTISSTWTGIIRSPACRSDDGPGGVSTLWAWSMITSPKANSSYGGKTRPMGWPGLKGMVSPSR